MRMPTEIIDRRILLYAMHKCERHLNAKAGVLFESADEDILPESNVGEIRKSAKALSSASSLLTGMCIKFEEVPVEQILDNLKSAGLDEIVEKAVYNVTQDIISPLLRSLVVKDDS